MCVLPGRTLCFRRKKWALTDEQAMRQQLFLRKRFANDGRSWCLLIFSGEPKEGAASRRRRRRESASTCHPKALPARRSSLSPISHLMCQHGSNNNDFFLSLPLSRFLGFPCVRIRARHLEIARRPWRRSKTEKNEGAKRENSAFWCRRTLIKDAQIRLCEGITRFRHRPGFTMAASARPPFPT